MASDVGFADDVEVEKPRCLRGLISCSDPCEGAGTDQRTQLRYCARNRPNGLQLVDRCL